MLLSNNETFILYLVIIFISALFVSLYQNRQRLLVIKYKLNNKQIFTINNYTIYVLICFVPMIFILASRYYTGADYEQYTWNYWTVTRNNILDATSIFKQEPLYTLSIKIASYIFPNKPQFWFVLMAIIMFVNIVISIRIFELRNIAEFVILFGLFSYLHSFNYVRQMVAASIIIMAVGYLIKRDKTITFLCLILVATLIHRSSFFFIILWPICKLSKEKLILYRVLVIASPLYVTVMVRIIKYIPFLRRYESYFTNSVQFGIGFLIELMPLIVLLIIANKSTSEESKIKSILSDIGLLAIPFRFMSYFAYGAGRLFITCSFFSILAYCLSRKKALIKLFVVAVFLIYFIVEFYLLNNSEVFPYQFCF